MKNQEKLHDASGDARLGGLLRAARLAPGLPPGFRNLVWRRIETAEARASQPTWVEAVLAWLLRPRLAIATALVLVIAGAAVGAAQGTRSADELSKILYVNSVSPPELRR